MTATNPGARSNRRRVDLDVTTVLAVLLPVLTLVAVLLVRPGAEQESAHAPTLTALSSASVICPSALPGDAAVRLTTARAHARGQVTVSAGEDTQQVRVASGRVSTATPGEGPVVVTGRDDLAPALVAARSVAAPLAAVGCPPTTPDQWFTGVGAGAGHTSVLELVNPDAGPAIADVTLYGRAGAIDVPRLRGVSVPGRGSVRLDLGKVVPRRDELTLHVVTSRGRLAATVLDRYDELGAGRSSAEWLPSQAAPATSNLLLGAPAGEGTRTLVLTNPGDSETRVTVRFVSEDSVFAPRGLDEVLLAPGAVKRVSVTDALGGAVPDGTFGLQVDATAPVTATLRSFVDGDLSHATSGTAFGKTSAVIVPRGDKRLLLAGAPRAGVVTVVARDDAGRELARRRAEVAPGRGTVVGLPAGATLVSVEPARTTVVGAVEITGRGAAVVPLTELVRNGLVPDVGPGLP